jgi:hypothetical protein
MSVKAMGAVWDLKIEPEEKFVLLAYADHADHNGFSIFPAVSSIAEKTGYSERSVQRITRRLEEKGYLIADGQGPHGTNKWKMPMHRGAILSPPMDGEGVTPETMGVTPVTPRGDTAMSPEPSLTINEPSINESKPKIDLPVGSDIGWLINHDASAEEIERLLEVDQRKVEIINTYEQAMGYNPLSWGNRKYERLLKFLLKQSIEDIKKFAIWSRREFSSFSPSKALMDPDKVIQIWPQAFPIQTPTQPHEPGKGFFA